MIGFVTTKVAKVVMSKVEEIFSESFVIGDYKSRSNEYEAITRCDVQFVVHNTSCEVHCQCLAPRVCLVPVLDVTEKQWVRFNFKHACDDIGQVVNSVK